MGLKFVVLSISAATALVAVEANASSMSLGAAKNFGGNEAGLVEAVAGSGASLRRAATSVTGDAVSFVSAARPGRWVSEFFPNKTGASVEPVVVPVQSFPIAGSELDTVDSAQAVRDLRAVVAGEQANPFFRFRASDYVATASSEPFALADIGFGGAGGAMVMDAARTVFSAAPEMSSRASGNTPPSGYVMLLAGLGLISLMVRQRLSEG